MNKTDWRFLYVLVLFELVLLGIGVVLGDYSHRQEEILAVQSITDTEQNRRIENLEKELRITKSNSEFVINLITDKGYKE